MPLLGTLIAGLIRILFAVFGRFMVAEKAYHLAMMVVVLALATAIVASMNSCATGACAMAIGAMSSTHPNFGVGLSLAFNSTTYTAMSCYFVVWSGCQMYVMKKKMITLLG